MPEDGPRKMLSPGPVTMKSEEEKPRGGRTILADRGDGGATELNSQAGEALLVRSSTTTTATGEKGGERPE
jgi:hypothetical protein